jgi:SAM-dependent methyltransferase
VSSASINPAAALGFGRGADDYEQARPSYPQAAIDLLVHELALRPGRRVLDLAAGTGKLTRLLVATGVEVVAVEPVGAMREQFAAILPDVPIIEGTPW